jgi:hypothetical protein
MLNPIFNEDIVLHDTFSSTDTLLKNGQFSAMVSAPWRQSNTARNSISIHDSDGKNKYILTSMFSFSGSKLSNNPYIPQFWEKTGIGNYLVSKSGEVRSIKHEQLQYYWASFVENQCVMDIDNAEKSNVIKNFIVNYSLLNKKAIHASRLCLEILNESCFLKINKNADREFLKSISIRIKKKLPAEFMASWSHGDLWIKDIFKKEDGFTIIDWEWCTPHAPAGIDILDLVCYNNWPNWQMLLKDVCNSTEDGGIFNGVELIGETSCEYRNAISIFFIYRLVAKIVAQEGIYKVMKNKIYKRMIKYLING